MYVLAYNYRSSFYVVGISKIKTHLLPELHREIAEYIKDGAPQPGDVARKLLKEAWEDVDRLISVWNENYYLEFILVQQQKDLGESSSSVVFEDVFPATD